MKVCDTEYYQNATSREQGRRNSIISGEATSNIANFFALFPKKLVCQPLISGEAAASPASPVPTPLPILFLIH